MFLSQMPSQSCFLGSPHLSMVRSWWLGRRHAILSPRDPSSYQMTVGSEVLSEHTSVLSDHGLGVHTQTSATPAPHLPEHGSHSTHSAVSGALRSAQWSRLSTSGHVSGIIPVYPVFSCPHCLSLQFLLINTHNPGFLSLTFLGSRNTGLPGSGLGFTLLNLV